MPAMASPWNSLELVKLVVSGATPLLVLLLGLLINRQLKRFEYLQWTSQKVVEKRLTIYSDLVPILNDLLCYFTYVGCWKELTPPEVVKLKRAADRIVYVNAALFSGDFPRIYNEFINHCFHTYSDWGHDARLRTMSERRQEAHKEWVSEWNSCFAENAHCSDPNHIKASYQKLVSSFAKELGVGLKVGELPSGRLPTDIK